MKRKIKRKIHRHSKQYLAGCVISCTLISTNQSFAQTPPRESTLRLQYSDYQDYQDYQTHNDRMHIKAPALWLQTPISEVYELTAHGVIDGMSGASPLYLDTVSGASKEGIRDTRKAVDTTLTRYFENSSLGAGVIYSTEQDYTSKGLLIESKVWDDAKNNILSFGLSGNNDHITSSNDSALDEERKTYNALLGYTKVLNPVSSLQTNLTYTTGDGYFSDPYKTYDARPRSRDTFAFLTRYVHYVESYNASLHLDYRVTHDSWGLTSHMAEAAVYKPLGTWILRPALRYYTQSAASFFEDTFPPATIEGIYSADQRLSAFGALTTSLWISKELSKKCSLDLELGFITQDSSLGIFGSDAKLETFYATFTTIGITQKF